MDRGFACRNHPWDPQRWVAGDRDPRWRCLHAHTSQVQDRDRGHRHAQENVSSLEGVFNAVQRNEDEERRHQEHHEDPEQWMLRGAVDRVSYSDHGAGC